MGRYLAYGINTKVNISKKDDWNSSDDFSIQKNKKQILNQLNNFFDMSMYECIKEEEESLEFSLKNESFSNNIYDLLDEMKKDFPLKVFFGNLDTDECLEKREPMNLTDYGIVLKDYELGLDFYSAGLEYIVFDEELYDNFKILTDNAILWCGIDKLDSEDDLYLCNIINTVSREHYKSKLAKNAIFLIFG